MKPFLLTLLLAACSVTGYGQTIKSLGFNTTNGQIVAATNVVWTNAFSFSTNTVAAQVRTNFGLGATWLTNTNAANFRAAISAGTVNEGGVPSFQSIDLNDSPDSLILVANAKTTMRNLAGSTNTNHPYSGTVEFQDFSDNTVSIVVSNGIILNVTGP
jgi:hypothetical protein